MPKLTPIDYADASPAVRAVYDDVKASRDVPDVNNLWKYPAHDPATLKRPVLELPGGKLLVGFRPDDDAKLRERPRLHRTDGSQP